MEIRKTEDHAKVRHSQYLGMHTVKAGVLVIRSGEARLLVTMFGNMQSTCETFFSHLEVRGSIYTQRELFNASNEAPTFIWVYSSLYINSLCAASCTYLFCQH